MKENLVCEVKVFKQRSRQAKSGRSLIGAFRAISHVSIHKLPVMPGYFLN